MALTSKEINEQGFETAFRGYDMKQVDGYLEYIANEVDVLNSVILDYEDQIEKLKSGAPEITQDLGTGVIESEAASSEDLEAAQKEVEEYKTKVADLQSQVDSLNLKLSSNAELEIANAKIKQLEEKVQEQTRDANVISEAYIAAQRGADELVEKARQEGERIYKEAEASARQFLTDAMTEKQKIIDEVAKLKDSCDSFRAQYTQMLEKFTLESKTQFAQLSSPVVDPNDVTTRMPKSTYNANPSEESTSEENKTSIFDDNIEDASVSDIVGSHELSDSDKQKPYTIDTDISDLEEA